MKVNEGMRLKENSEKLELLQTHVDLQGTIHFYRICFKVFSYEKMQKIEKEILKRLV